MTLQHVWRKSNVEIMFASKRGTRVYIVNVCTETTRSNEGLRRKCEMRASKVHGRIPALFFLRAGPERALSVGFNHVLQIKFHELVFIILLYNHEQLDCPHIGLADRRSNHNSNLGVY